MVKTDVPTQEKILPIVLPSLVEVENFSDHPRNYFKLHQNAFPFIRS